MSLFKNFNLNKLKEGLTKTREKLFNSITEAVTGKAVIDDLTIDRIEEILITSDIGYDTAERIISDVRKNLKSEKDRTAENILEIVKKELIKTLEVFNKSENGLIKNRM
jgi:Signal recognition particle GTPase